MVFFFYRWDVALIIGRPLLAIDYKFSSLKLRLMLLFMLAIKDF
jgi:hypothetical protein